MSHNLDILHGQLDPLSLISLPRYRQPLVSIIIPVHNQWAYTHSCLASIVKNSGDVPYEVIVADDVSTDETLAIQERVSGVRVVRNSINMGFLRNCKKAAGEGNGKYLLFLNNDTNVQPGWLECLVELMEKDPSIAISGSRLAYPDGRLQEAGGVIWSNASGRNYGRLESPLMPEFNYVKEVDYISGASIIVRRTFWDEVGGFDERFAPAYYEDTDLAFMARKHGYKVVLQPKSMVVHFEGISHGTDISSGIKSYQVRNKELFCEKWKNVLSGEQLPRDQHIFWARDRTRNKKTLLFLDYQATASASPVIPLETQICLRLLLDLGLNVKVMPADFQRVESYSSPLNQIGIETLDGEWFQSNWRSWIKSHASYFDFVVLNGPDTAAVPIDFFREELRATYLFLAHDLLTDARNGQRETLGSAVRKCDIIFCFTEENTCAIAAMVPDKSVETLPLPHGSSEVVVQDELSGNTDYSAAREKLCSVLERHEKYQLLEPNVMQSEGAFVIDSKKSSNCKAIAFYLPQYHPIPENDEWWGKGFTEWTNVAKAKPQFPGHYQPHLPSELGFYDLRLPEVRNAQAELAKEYGLHGFCYYHYWFNGKLLLEKPLHDMLNSGVPDLPFCLCWANESWTRTWDGRSGQVLLEQQYSEDDDRKHLRYLSQFLQHKRYIKINEKPLLLFYRANHMPDPCKTAEIMRDEARKIGIGEIYLCRVESFPNEHTDPTTIGFDAAVEFQPDWTNLGKKAEKPIYGDHTVYSYEDVVNRMLTKKTPPYKRFPCVTPSWDNSSRRKSQAMIFTGSTPKLYEKWLRHAIRKADKDNPDDNIVFINAWNEWGEGNHLEPDQVFGRAYLEATRSALENAETTPAEDIVLAPGSVPVMPLVDHDRVVAKFAEDLASKVRRLAEQEQEIIEKNRLLAEQESQLREREQQIHDLHHSSSWRITAPLRWGYEFITGNLNLQKSQR